MPAGSGRSLAGHQLTPCRSPRPATQVADGVAGECQQVQCGQHGRKVLLAVAEIVLQVIALGLQSVEAFVLDLPACPAARGKFGHVVPVDRQVGDEAVAIGHLAVGIEDLDHQPVDRHRLGVAAQRHIAQPLVAVGRPLLAAPDLPGQFIQLDAGTEFLDRRVRVWLADEQKVRRLRPARPGRWAGGRTGRRRDTPA